MDKNALPARQSLQWAWEGESGGCFSTSTAGLRNARIASGISRQPTSSICRPDICLYSGVEETVIQKIHQIQRRPRASSSSSTRWLLARGIYLTKFLHDSDAGLDHPSWIGSRSKSSTLRGRSAGSECCDFYQSEAMQRSVHLFPGSSAAPARPAHTDAPWLKAAHDQIPVHDAVGHAQQQGVPQEALVFSMPLAFREMTGMWESPALSSALRIKAT